MTSDTRPGGEPALPDDADTWHYLNAPVVVCLTDSVQNSKWNAKRAWQWAEIVREHVETPRKEDAPLWSFVLPSKPDRRADSVDFVTALAFDFDGKAGPDWDNVLDQFSLVNHWAYTTFSHSPDSHAFRVVLPLETAIPASEYPEAWQAAVDILEIGAWVDPSCKDLARLFYLPSCAPGAERRQFGAWQFGCFDWSAWLAVWRSRKMAQSAPPKFSEPDAVPRVRKYAIGDRITELDIQREKLVRMLQSMSPDRDYASWMRIILGVGKAMGLEGVDILEQWSQQSNKYNAADWKAFRRKAGFGG